MSSHNQNKQNEKENIFVRLISKHPYKFLSICFILFLFLLVNKIHMSGKYPKLQTLIENYLSFIIL